MDFNKIAKFLILPLALAAFLFYVNFARAAEPPAPAAETQKIRVIYFYADDCPNCQKIKPFIEQIKEKYKDRIDFLEHNVKEKEECRQLFYHFIEAYGLPSDKLKVPLIFAGNDYLLGVKDIEANLEAKIDEKIAKKEGLKFDCHEFLKDWEKNGGNISNGDSGGASCGIIQIDDSCAIIGPNGDNSGKKTKAISIGLIISTAAIDSINPCAIAVLLFLIAVLISLKATKKRIIAIGLVYISGVFISYYLAGVGLLKAISHFDIATQINLFAAAIVIIAAFISIKEGLYPDSKQILVIPEKTKKIFINLMQKGTFPAVFIAGVLVSAFELPCTGQVYLGILSLMSQENMKAQAYAYLLIYNFIFVLPLIIILLAAAWGLDIEKLKNLRKDTRKIIKVLIGAIMFILGVWLIYTTLY
jgi:cytochrome c biogenesis protein CcdA/glutaredoxin